MTTSAHYTIDELISVCICRQIVNGEVVAQGIATPLVMAGILLAKLTHAPDIWIASAVGGTLCRDWAPLGLAGVEKPWLDHGLVLMSFPRITCEFLPRFNVREFFRPAQVDARGNFNNVFIGSDYARPQIRLPGSGGIPDVTLFDQHAMLYVPRHSRAVFVEQIDFSAAWARAQPNAGRGPQLHHQSGAVRLRARAHAADFVSSRPIDREDSGQDRLAEVRRRARDRAADRGRSAPAARRDRSAGRAAGDAERARSARSDFREISLMRALMSDE
jgi:acyl CoA:acetate/3-ketoacid CoA transferase beta subunit